jgi:putative restriction endonuclease
MNELEVNNRDKSLLEERLNLWKKIKEIDDGEVLPSYIKELRIYKGATGICRDDSGICISILNTGKDYPDEIFDGGILYHYPNTKKRSKSYDINETNSLKQCASLKLPIFIISPGNNTKKRTVRFGWVEDYDDDSELFLIKFGETQPIQSQEIVEQEFVPKTKRRKRTKEGGTRSNNQAKFRFDVLKRYGTKCAVCNIENKYILDAAHIIPVDKDGTDDPRNGLILCKNHHAAFDRNMFSINLSDFSIENKESLINISESKLQTKTGRMPHIKALEYRFRT